MNYRGFIARLLFLMTSSCLLFLATDVAAQSPTSAVAWKALGDRQIAESKFEESVFSYSECVRLDLKSAQCYRDRANAYTLGYKNYEAAVRDLTHSLRIVPRDADTLVSRARAYAAWGRKTEALADYATAIEINPKDPRPYVLRAISHCADGNTLLATSDEVKVTSLGAEVPIKCSSGLIARNPPGTPEPIKKRERARELYMRGNGHDAAGKVAEAASSYELAAKADPTFFDPNIKLAEIYVKYRKFKEAKPYAGAASLLDPDNSVARSVRSTVETELAAETKLISDPNYAEAMKLIGDAEKLAESAFGELETPAVATRSINDGLAKINAAIKIGGAAGVVSKALQVRGLLYFAESNIPKSPTVARSRTAAFTALDEAIKKDPNLARNYTVRGTIFLAGGEKEKAIADFKNALRIDPFDELADEGLSRAIN